MAMQIKEHDSFASQEAAKQHLKLKSKQSRQQRTGNRSWTERARNASLALMGVGALGALGGTTVKNYKQETAQQVPGIEQRTDLTDNRVLRLSTGAMGVGTLGLMPAVFGRRRRKIMPDEQPGKDEGEQKKQLSEAEKRNLDRTKKALAIEGAVAALGVAAVTGTLIPVAAAEATILTVAGATNLYKREKGKREIRSQKVISTPGLPVDLRVGKGESVGSFTLHRQAKIGSPDEKESSDDLLVLAVPKETAQVAKAWTGDHERHIKLLKSSSLPKQEGLHEVLTGQRDSHTLPNETTIVVLDPTHDHRVLAHFTIEGAHEEVSHEVAHHVIHVPLEERPSHDKPLRSLPIHLNDIGTEHEFHPLEFRFPMVDFVDDKKTLRIDTTPIKGSNILLFGDSGSVDVDEARLFPQVDELFVKRSKTGAYVLVLKDSEGGIGINGYQIEREGESSGAVIERSTASRAETVTEIPLTSKVKIRLQKSANTAKARDALLVDFDPGKGDPTLILGGPDKGELKFTHTKGYVTTFAAGREYEARVGEEKVRLLEERKNEERQKAEAGLKKKRKRELVDDPFNPLRRKS